MQIPRSLVIPYGMLELVLHIEQPHADGCCEHHDWEMHKEKSFNANEPDERANDQCDRRIGRHGAEPRLPSGTHQPHGQALLKQEQVHGPDAKHHQWMTVEPIFQAAPPRTCAIFAYCQCVQVTDAAAAEIARCGMVHGVGAPPKIVGREGDYANDATGPVVRTPIGKEGPVTAVVLNYEQAYEKATGGHGDEEGSPRLTQPEGKP